MDGRILRVGLGDGGGEGARSTGEKSVSRPIRRVPAPDPFSARMVRRPQLMSGCHSLRHSRSQWAIPSRPACTASRFEFQRFANLSHNPRRDGGQAANGTRTVAECETRSYMRVSFSCKLMVVARTGGPPVTLARLSRLLLCINALAARLFVGSKMT